MPSIIQIQLFRNDFLINIYKRVRVYIYRFKFNPMIENNEHTIIIFAIIVLTYGTKPAVDIQYKTRIISTSIFLIHHITFKRGTD